MIEYILPEIKDAGDYRAALSLFKADAPLSPEEAAQLMSIYEKYGKGAEAPALARLYIALDLLPGRTRDDIADFAALELTEDDLEALFLMQDLICGRAELTGAAASAVVAAVGGLLTRPVDILLARAALDAISGSRDFSGLREQAAALAAFLTGLGPEVVDRYSVLLGEVRMKCRR